MTEMKKQHSLPRVRLMRQAAVIRRNNDMNRRDALIIAHRIGGLIRKMHRENVNSATPSRTEPCATLSARSPDINTVFTAPICHDRKIRL